VDRPAVLTESAARFGSQCVVASIDAAARAGGGWEVYVKGGRQATGLDAVEWAQRCVELGAGEILLTSIDRDGARTGYDLDLTHAIASRVAVPVVASGGAGTPAHMSEVLRHAGADAALVAGILHDGVTTVSEIKAVLARDGVPVRQAA
jgi:imidazole glycerol-phosphate synthase subunit HisF